jgi:very-short-patch-repair endonuclease
MRTQVTNGRDWAFGHLADRQYRVVSRGQLLAAGLGRETIGRAVRSGRLRPVFRGVYAVGHMALRREAWWMAALLVARDGATLSHRSAAVMWDLLRGPILPVELITTGDRRRRQPRVLTHRMRLDPTEIVIRDGLQVTTPPRTIVDLAPLLARRSLRETVERAQDLHRFRPVEIRTILDRDPGRPGTRPLSDLLALLQPDADNARSHLERLFLALVRRARLPRPAVNEVIGGRSRDFVWPKERLVVETDGYRYHSSKRAQRRDRRRDRELTALGWRPVRFTYEEIAFEPGEVARELAALLRSG